MAFIDFEARALLAVMGDQLDNGCYPMVHDGGIVQSSNLAVQSDMQGVEKRHGQRQQQRRSAARPWQGAAGWQGPTHRSGSPRRAAPIIDPGIRRAYESQLDHVRSAYPSAKVWLRDTGLWLRTESLILPGLTRRVTFLTAIPFLRDGRASAWAYWTTPISLSWIGPRHTNFPDGSVCAFEPRDATWAIGDSVVKLLDLYTVWALRHLHLELLGRWPGYQSVPIPYERLWELEDDELCGCDRSHVQYSKCCKPADMALDRQQAFADFVMLTGGIRNPPTWVTPIIWGTKEPPTDLYGVKAPSRNLLM